MNKEFWRIGYAWLKSCGNNVNKEFCRDEMSSHPEYPALPSLIDFLESGQFKYVAARATVEDVASFQFPVLTHFKKAGQEYLEQIKDIEDWHQHPDIKNSWSGVVIFPKADARFVHPENTKALSKQRNQYVVFVALAIIIFSTFVFSVLQFPQVLLNSIGFFMLIGIVVSVVMIGAEMGLQSQMVKQVCGAVSKGGCNTVMNSRFGSGILGITPADISLIYFVCQYILYLWTIFTGTANLTLVFTALVAVPIIGWSIYVQGFILKTWCALCLSVAIVLLFQAASAGMLISGNQFSVYLDWKTLLLYLFAFITLAAIYYPVKQVLKQNKALKSQVRDFKKWKADSAIFFGLWRKEKLMKELPVEPDFVIGNLTAPVIITMACSPYCSPCAGAHKQVDKLLARFGNDLALRLRFVCDAADPENENTKVVNAMLHQISSGNSNEAIHAMVSEWFSEMNYDKWIHRWGLTSNESMYAQLKIQEDWIDQNQIQFTPTIYINERRLPGRYVLADLEILLPQLIDYFKK